MEFKSYNPSDENIRKTLEKDVLGRNKDIVYFISLLNSIDNSCAIALNGEWGSGKTFFVKQVKLLLDKMNPHIINHCDDPNLSETSIDNLANVVKSRCNNIPNVSVYYDCWENDNTMYSIVCRTVIDYFHFELREIERFVHLTKIAFSESMRSTITYENAFDDGKGRSLYITCYVPVLIALSIIDQNMYYVFIHGNDESSIKLFTDIMCKNDDIISYILHLLVGDHEQPSSNEDERKKLCKNKLRETYDAIFNRSSTSYGYISINRCSFGTNAKEDILRIVSLLSRYADYS